MSGIDAFGVFVPAHRIARVLLAGKTRAEGPERSVAWSDEDSVTMGVEAARRAIAGIDRDTIDLLLFATTTHGFVEKQGAAIVAAALGLSSTARTVDVAHSLRGGVTALRLACEAVDSGARHALVVIADAREGVPGSKLEREGGDAAVAFLVGPEGRVASFDAAAVVSQEIVDIWRRPGDRFVHSWEERFTTRYGESEPALAAASALREKAGIAPQRWAVGASDARALGGFAARMKLPADAVVDGLYDRVGFSGVAHAPLLLAAALDGGAAGDRVAVVAHGDGAEAMLFTLRAAGGGGVMAAALARRIPVETLAVWRRARALDMTEYAPADYSGVSATAHYRDRDANLALRGQRCMCGEPQFPSARICIRCNKRDTYSPETFADRSGEVVTFTLDAFFPSATPPTPVAIVQVDNGPRLYLQIADTAPADVAIGLPVTFAFRRIHEAGRRPNYFWKAVAEEPVR